MNTPTFLEVGETYIEVDLTSPWFLFTEEENRRHQTWSNVAQLVAWVGLTAVLVAVLVFSFYTAVEARAATVCVSSQMVEMGQAAVINPETCS